MASSREKQTKKQKTKERKYPDRSEIKMVVMGGLGVGKSSLTIRFVQNYFPEDVDPTLEDSYRKQVGIDDCTYLFDILDVAGQEEYACLRESYIRTGEVFFFIFSIDKQDTFDELPDEIEKVLRVKDEYFVDAILIGNKSDLEDQRQVPREKAMELAERYQIPYMETSAKTGDFVEESFFNLVRFANGDTIIPQHMAINVKKAR